MARATVGFLDENGNFQPVKASRPLPTSGGGGGGGGGVQSVNGDTGPAVELDAADVGAATPEQVALKISYPNEAPGQTNRVMLFDTTGKVITYGNAVTTASQGSIPLRTTGGHIILPATDASNANWAARQGAVTAKLTATQGAAVANATDEASAVTQLNALLVSLRAGGIIQT